MKNNLKIRAMALLLCLVMLFSVGCVSQSNTEEPATDADASASVGHEDETPADEPSDEPAEAPDTSADEPSDEDAEEDEYEPDYPENGMTAIYTEPRPVYVSADVSDTVTLSFYEDCPEIPLISTDVMCAEFFDTYLAAQGQYTYEETETTLTITRHNGSYCEIDFVADTLYFNDFDRFMAFRDGGMADILALPYVDEAGNSIYFKKLVSLDVAGLPIYIDLAARNIPLDIYEGEKYMPFQTFNDVFLSPLAHSFVYNGQALFVADSGKVSPDLMELYYSVGASEKSEALASFSANELTLVMDLFYGLQSEHDVVVGFDRFLEHTGLWEGLNSTDPFVSTNAIASLMFGYLADMHSALNMPSAYTGSASFDYSQATINTSVMHYNDHLVDYSTARAMAMPEGVSAYTEVGNTAYITFDSFTLDPVTRAQGYSEQSKQIVDTMGIVIYAHSMITRENSPIENVVLDLSCNGGGTVDSAVYVVAWMLGYCDFHITNPITGGYSTSTYKVDVNLDGVFDKNDNISDKNLYCIISPISFSCANLVPSLLKESGCVTILGNTSGGGACTVQPVSTADGCAYQISSARRLSIVSNGSYYTVDRGVEPHYYLGKLSSYYDRAALTDYINELK